MKLEDALFEAIQHEDQARATYLAIIDEFGPVRPFVNIVESEAGGGGGGRCGEGRGHQCRRGHRCRGGRVE